MSAALDRAGIVRVSRSRHVPLLRVPRQLRSVDLQSPPVPWLRPGPRSRAASSAALCVEPVLLCSDFGVGDVKCPEVGQNQRIMAPSSSYQKSE